jgi:hypothetical protein
MSAVLNKFMNGGTFKVTIKIFHRIKNNNLNLFKKSIRESFEMINYYGKKNCLGLR